MQQQYNSRRNLKQHNKKIKYLLKTNKNTKNNKKLTNNKKTNINNIPNILSNPKNNNTSTNTNNFLIPLSKLTKFTKLLLYKTLFNVSKIKLI